MRVEGQYFVYILECCDGSYYVGFTSDPEQRLESHQAGRGGAYTSKRLPVRLLFQEFQPTEAAAARREQQIKRWSRNKKAALISGDMASLQALARKQKKPPR